MINKDNYSSVIETKINEFDNMAIEILKHIEIQRNLVLKGKNLWGKLLEDASKELLNLIPGVFEISLVLENALKQFKELNQFILKYYEEQQNNRRVLALHYNSKLIELLNKY